MALSRISNTADGWIDLIFASKSAKSGGVVRRNVTWVAQEIGEARLVAEVRQRGFHMVRNGHQFVIFCNNRAIDIIV